MKTSSREKAKKLKERRLQRLKPFPVVCLKTPESEERKLPFTCDPTCEFYSYCSWVCFPKEVRPKLTREQLSRRWLCFWHMWELNGTCLKRWHKTNRAICGLCREHLPRSHWEIKLGIESVYPIDSHPM